jgi:RNA polymerase sigma-70 factor (ECF subfamily)
MLRIADLASAGAWNPLCAITFDDPRSRADLASPRLGRLRSGVGTRQRGRVVDSGPPSRGRRGVLTEVKQLQADAGDGLNGLYRRYAAWLDRRLRARVSPQDAEDVVQETYIRIAPYADGGIRHPKAFLLKVALNLVRDGGRRDARRNSVDQPAVPDIEAPSQYDQVLLGQIVRSMPVLYRDVFVLSRFDGMTYPEIAEMLDVSIKTVEWRMSKALEYCALRLDL